MASVMYIENTLLGRRIFTLTADKLEVENVSGPRHFKRSVNLNQASPQIESLSRRIDWAYLIAIPPVIIGALIVKITWGPELYRHEMAAFVVALVIIFVGSSVAAIPTIKFVRIRSNRGVVLMDIAEDRRNKSDFRFFVESVRQRIALHGSRMQDLRLPIPPNQSTDPTFSSGTPGAGHQPRQT